MSKLTLSFSSDDVRRIVDAFESRYGQPSRVEENEIVTKRGGRFTNTAWHWNFQESANSIIQRSSRLAKPAGWEPLCGRESLP